MSEEIEQVLYMDLLVVYCECYTDERSEASRKSADTVLKAIHEVVRPRAKMKV